MPEKVLVAGNNVRNVAESASKAGFEVFAITKFVDADLRIYCRKWKGLTTLCQKKRLLRK